MGAPGGGATRPVQQPTPVSRGAAFLSVVVPCSRAGEDLREQLDALAAQQHDGPWEVVLADNEGSGELARLVEDYAGRLPGLRIVDASARRGKPFAVNTAVRHTKGDFLVMLDADDVVAPGYLAAVAAASSTAEVLGARLDASALNPEWLQRRRAPVQEDGLHRFLGYLPAVVGAGFSVSRAAYDAVGGFSEEMPHQHDIDLSWRLSQAGFAPAFVPEAVVRYRYRADLRGTWTQELAYGEYEVLLYARHRQHGVPSRRLRSSVRGWLRVLGALVLVGNQAGRARLVTVTGGALGRLRGSVKHRVLYL